MEKITSYNPTSVDLLRSLVSTKITLNDYVKAFYDAEIFPFPTDGIETIKKIIDLSIQLYKKYPYTGRVNEMGNYMEEILHRTIMEMNFGSSKKLGTGYPDNCSNINGIEFPIYFEPKVTANILHHSSFRKFYTSVPASTTKNRKKIKDGFHLLIDYEHDGNSSLTGRYKITDLDGFIYQMVNKQEGSSKDIYEIHNKVILENDNLE